MAITVIQDMEPITLVNDNSPFVISSDNYIQPKFYYLYYLIDKNGVVV